MQFISPLQQRVARFLATGFGFGLLPWSPGTFGTIPGVMLAYLLRFAAEQMQLSATAYHVLASVWLALIVLLAVAVINRVEGVTLEHDDSRIVIDEIVGVNFALLFLPLTITTWALAIGLFRVFDIFKVGPIRWADQQLKGAWGTLLDDIFAGMAALLATVVITFLVR